MNRVTDPVFKSYVSNIINLLLLLLLLLMMMTRHISPIFNTFYFRF